MVKPKRTSPSAISHGVRQLRIDARPQIHRPPWRRVRHHGRQRLWQKHLLRHLIGLNEPAKGEIWYGKESSPQPTRAEAADGPTHGLLSQSGALWSSMTLAENIGSARRVYGSHARADPRGRIAKARPRGPERFRRYYPSQISGGMQKRAGLARAMALDPDMLFFESRRRVSIRSARDCSRFILELRESLGATVVVVTHELASIFAIANNSVFLDAETRTMIAGGDPKELLANSRNPTVRRFLTRGEEERV